MIKPLGWTLGAAFVVATAMTIAHPHRGAEGFGDQVGTVHSIRLWGHDIGFELFVRHAISPSPNAESETTTDSVEACFTDGVAPLVIVLPGGTLQYRP